ncbi:GYD domain-containing protein [Haloarchaeobius sp. HME9146]|uniref:GYD domain-containing protein n=1 Tax=Haloarchaeobius sp. HME9146 TaxID=2978732 RepID=UPI0021BFAE3C|nr:GYD domain-containing protein [Haloarchaeobius sp. HME9146]MCT9095759.1 GYD domain-containing protein [Haloarchaeobius sp. HME9146]
MGMYTSLVRVRDRDINNVQELASLWGEIHTEVEEYDATLEDTYAVLGDYDFIVIFDADGRDEAFKVALAMERHGLDMQTMEVIPTDDFAELVTDI